MFDTLTTSFRGARRRLQGFRRLDEEIIDQTLQEIRTSLLEADVEFGVVKGFLASLRERALGELVLTRVSHRGQKHKVTPADQFIRICHEELVALMGDGDVDLNEGPGGFTTVMVVGLQGSGKTTTAAKLAKLMQREGRKPLLVAADIYRPAAVHQLKVLGERIDVPVFHEEGISPPELCSRGVEEARRQGCNAVIFDTAGRLTIDEKLMEEIGEIRSITSPDNTLLVIDAMIGQDAVRTAKSFHERVPLDGVVLTKLDGDARGGAALSVRQVTGRPILFVGMGEDLDRLERFRPHGMADRILGMGDIVGLVQDFERVVDSEKAEKDAERMLKGDFTFNDFLEQLHAIKQMGSVRDIFEKLPFFDEMLPEGANLDDGELLKVESMIHSMTRQERAQPEILQEAGRMERVARGSGRTVQQVQDLTGRFKSMRDLMSAIGSQPGLLGKIPGFQQIAQMAKLKNMDMGQFFGGAGGPSRGKRPKKPPVALARLDAKSARKARKAARARTKGKARRR